MGMDVIGLNPTSEEGIYFGIAIWAWRPLAAFCKTVAPEICAPCRHWFSNGGDGLDAEHSSLLAQRLDEAMTDGSLEMCLEQGRAHPDYESIRAVLSREIISEFVAFLASSGGFRIW